jgi:transmembrane sensor
MTENDFDDLDWAQIARYLGGELSPAEARALELWFEADERHRRLLQEVRAAWEASGSLKAPWDAEAAVQRLRDAAVDGSVVLPRGSARTTRPPLFLPPRRRRLPATIAASIALLALAGGLLWRFAQPASGPVTQAPATTEVATRPAQRAEIRLPDGSRVLLGVASRLRYGRDFGGRARTVELEGEAYFEVVRVAQRPFRVRAGVGELEDVGTAFVVRSYGGRGVQVVVARGAVMVRRPSAPVDQLLVTEAQLARLDENGIVRRKDVNVARYLAWTRGELVFTDAPLTDVATELSRWFDVDVRVSDPRIRARRFTGSFGHQPVTSVVHAIAAATDVDLVHTPEGWRFRAKPPAS